MPYGTYSRKVSVAQLESAKKYQSKFAKVQLHMDKERVAVYKAKAKEMGYPSFTQFVIDAIEKMIE